MVLKISPKSHWNGKPPKEEVPLTLPIKHVVFSFITHTTPCYNLDECRLVVRGAQMVNMTMQKMTDIRFNFLVGGDGWVYEGRGWTSSPKMCQRLELIAESSILIGFIGDLKDESFSERIWEIGYELVEYGYQKKYISPNVKIFEETAEDYYSSKDR